MYLSLRSRPGDENSIAKVTNSENSDSLSQRFLEAYIKLNISRMFFVRVKTTALVGSRYPN